MERCLYCGDLISHTGQATGAFCSSEHQDAHAQLQAQAETDPLSEWKWAGLTPPSIAPAAVSDWRWLDLTSQIAALPPQNSESSAAPEISKRARRGFTAGDYVAVSIPAETGRRDSVSSRAGLFPYDLRVPALPSKSLAPRQPVLRAGLPIQLPMPGNSSIERIRLEYQPSFCVAKTGKLPVSLRHAGVESHAALRESGLIRIIPPASHGGIAPRWEPSHFSEVTAKTAYPPFEGAVEFTVEEFPPFILDRLLGAPAGPHASDCHAAVPAALLLMKRGTEEAKANPGRQLPPFRSIPMRILPSSFEPFLSFEPLPLTRGAAGGTAQGWRSALGIAVVGKVMPITC